jgi:transcriptional regulator with XRE-family HTH domain
MKTLPAGRQKRIKARASEMIEEYETLQELRKALNVTQEQMAREMGVKQENISRLEQRSDMLLSTLARAISVLGGKLDLTVRFKDKPDVSLGKLVDVASMTPARAPAQTRHSRPVARKKSRTVSRTRQQEHA